MTALAYSTTLWGMRLGSWTRASWDQAECGDTRHSEALRRRSPCVEVRRLPALSVALVTIVLTFPPYRIVKYEYGVE